jgi:hypothetical protein
MTVTNAHVNRSCSSRPPRRSSRAHPACCDESVLLRVAGGVGVAPRCPRPHRHPLASGSNLEYIARLAAANWGLWKTGTAVAERVDQFAMSPQVVRRQTCVHPQVRTLVQRFDNMPKTMAWRLRGRIGERKLCYQLPEEAH